MSQLVAKISAMSRLQYAVMGVGASALGALTYLISREQQPELPANLNWDQVGIFLSPFVLQCWQSYSGCNFCINYIST